jgi:Macrocin-O-methyltransferase (TylF)
LYQRIARVLRKITRTTKQPLADLRRDDQELISRIRLRKLTYLSNRRLGSVVKSCREVVAAQISGSFVEAGCALGGSTILLCSLKGKDRPLYVYDVFGIIPPPTSDDGQDSHERYYIISQGKSMGIGGNRYYGYEDNLHKIVQSNLKEFGVDQERDNVFLIKGLLQDTMAIDQRVAFAHIDVDWYEPVKTCLERIVPNLSVGGVMIIDDYDAWSGCRKATDEYFQKASGQFRMDDSAGSLKIIRISE